MMQACLLGHSLSILHPRSSTTGSGTVKIKHWLLLWTNLYLVLLKIIYELILLGVQATPYGSPVNPGWQVQTPLWFLAEQSAFLAHLQGSTHFSFWHASVLGHSGSVRHSYCLHLMYGSGSGLYPGGQEHTALWFLAVQRALVPHLSNGHGSTHSRLMQVWVSGHSESLLQPAKEEYNNQKLCDWVQSK
jgi:hypothetical protein